jgi:hypothetical protein
MKSVFVQLRIELMNEPIGKGHVGEPPELMHCHFVSSQRHRKLIHLLSPCSTSMGIVDARDYVLRGRFRS